MSPQTPPIRQPSPKAIEIAARLIGMRARRLALAAASEVETSPTDAVVDAQLNMAKRSDAEKRTKNTPPES